ncbi:hypothetical protein BKA93DRAFT_932152, partial [Sparassis latifolia]
MTLTTMSLRPIFPSTTLFLTCHGTVIASCTYHTPPADDTRSTGVCGRNDDFWASSRGCRVDWSARYWQESVPRTRFDQTAHGRPTDNLIDPTEYYLFRKSGAYLVSLMEMNVKLHSMINKMHKKIYP